MKISEQENQRETFIEIRVPGKEFSFEGETKKPNWLLQINTN